VKRGEEMDISHMTLSTDPSRFKLSGERKLNQLHLLQAQEAARTLSQAQLRALLHGKFPASMYSMLSSLPE